MVSQNRDVLQINAMVPRLRSNCLLKLYSELSLCAQVIPYRAKKDTKYTTELCCQFILRYLDDDVVVVQLILSFCAWDYLSINPALSC
jgi:hypothetical protein